MIELSIVIVSSAKTKELYNITRQAINTAIIASDISKEIIVCEDHVVYYPCAKMITTTGIDFNYNKFLNMGIEQSNGQYIALCNNDLRFGKNWDTVIINAMKANNILSACPSKNSTDKGITYGYEIMKTLLGWCIVIDRKLLNIIGRLDESTCFWYSDNLYANQLIRHGVKHAMIGGCRVDHLWSKTLKTLDAETKEKYTHGQKELL